MRSLSRATNLLVRRSAPTRRLLRSAAASSLLASPRASAMNGVKANQVADLAGARLQVVRPSTVLGCASTTTSHSLAEVAMLADGDEEDKLDSAGSSFDDRDRLS